MPALTHRQLIQISQSMLHLRNDRVHRIPVMRNSIRFNYQHHPMGDDMHDNYEKTTARYTAIIAALLAAGIGASAPAAVAADAENGAGNPADSKWRVRGRVIGIIPDDDSGNIFLEAGGASTELTNGVSVDSSVVPELDVTYMITPNIGIEAIAGIANHDVKIDGTDPTLAGLGVTDNMKIFDVWVLPPTLTLQYHFMPSAHFRPYAGFGVNYTAMLWNDATDNLESTLGSPVEVDTSNSWGWAAQFGFDYDINGKWFVNADVKYIDIETTASLQIKTLGAGLRVNADINPWVVGAGIGYRF